MKWILTRHLIDCAGMQAKVQEEPMAIQIQDGHIVRVEPFAKVRQELQNTGVEIIDAGDSYVIPGLIDAHVHLSFSASQQPLNELYGDDDATILLRMAQAARTELYSGVTTVRDCGARGMSILSLRDFIASGQMEGPDIMTAGMPLTITGGHCNFCGLECDSKDEVVKAVRQLCKQGVDYIKVMVSGGNMTPGSNSLIDQYDYETLQAIVSEAHQRGKQVSGHVHSVIGIENSIKAGLDTLEHCSFKWGDGERYRPDLVEQMKEKGISVNPALGKAYILPPELAAPLPDKVEMWGNFQKSRFETTRNMYEAGVDVIAGTDAGCKNTKFDEFYLTLNMFHEKVGMRKQDVLLSATALAARVLKLDDRIGSIQPGLQADMVIVRGNPLDDLLNLKEPVLVLKKGERVGRA